MRKTMSEQDIRLAAAQTFENVSIKNTADTHEKERPHDRLVRLQREDDEIRGLQREADEIRGIDDRDRARAGLLLALFARREADRALIESLYAHPAHPYGIDDRAQRLYSRIVADQALIQRLYARIEAPKTVAQPATDDEPAE